MSHDPHGGDGDHAAPPRAQRPRIPVTRIGDRIVETKDICGGPCHMNTARRFMRDFKARADAGEARPWDVDHFFRDEKERAEKAKREGRLEELAAIREMFLAATRGGADAARARETVTA